MQSRESQGAIYASLNIRNLIHLSLYSTENKVKAKPLQNNEALMR
jgi:hypothetical protein